MVDAADIQRLAEEIARRYAVEKVILFGSYAYGTPHDHSDVDLLVVMPYEGSSFRKGLDILRDVDPPFPCDLIVMKPDDFRRRYAQLNPLVGDAVDRGTVLYDRRSPILA